MARSTVRKPTFRFVDESTQIGVYSDVFTVEMEAETGMVALTFYQTGSSFDATKFGESQQIEEKTVRFLSKIHLSPRGFGLCQIRTREDYSCVR
jgi:hypothetical protein